MRHRHKLAVYGFKYGLIGFGSENVSSRTAKKLREFKVTTEPENCEQNAGGLCKSEGKQCSTRSFAVVDEFEREASISRELFKLQSREHEDYLIVSRVQPPQTLRE